MCIVSCRLHVLDIALDHDPLHARAHITVLELMVVIKLLWYVYNANPKFSECHLFLISHFFKIGNLIKPTLSRNPRISHTIATYFIASIHRSRSLKVICSKPLSVRLIFFARPPTSQRPLTSTTLYFFFILSTRLFMSLPPAIYFFLPVHYGTKQP